MKTPEKVSHTFEPVFDGQSRILILGTFPSVKSREQKFYYGHPQNRFWKVLSILTGEELPIAIEEKKAFLLCCHIAVWDVIASCEIVGSSDSSIRNVVANDVPSLLRKANIKTIFANGGKAYELYQRYLFKTCKKECVKLPSTSPANAAWDIGRLCGTWQQILGDIGIETKEDRG